jgi:hypothetical protein
MSRALQIIQQEAKEDPRTFLKNSPVRQLERLGFTVNPEGEQYGWQMVYGNYLVAAHAYEGYYIFSLLFKSSDGWVHTGIEKVPFNQVEHYLVRLKRILDRIPDVWKVRRTPRMPSPGDESSDAYAHL